MALFTATATIHIFPDLDAIGDRQEYHRRLDKGINNWIHKLEVFSAGATVVDISFNEITDRMVLIVVSYRSSTPTEVSLQVAIDRAISGEDDL